MKLTVSNFGDMPNGDNVQKFILENENGFSVSIISLGGIITSVKMPDKNGKIDDINLGFDTLDGYLGGHPYFGAIIGRFANRIDKGKFELNGESFQLAQNDGDNHLHGGNVGFDKVVWDAEVVETESAISLLLQYTSQDGEEAYPGNVECKVIYTLNEDDELHMDYEATTDKATPLNMTNHAYWNLAGAGSGPVYDHILKMNCDTFLPVGDNLIPIGEIAPVANTAMDFTNEKNIGQDINDTLAGYDHCYVINRDDGGLVLVASVYDPKSGRAMDVETTKPGIQLYTGNFLDGIRGADNKVFEKQGAFCLETQYFPDAVNQPTFPSCILQPGQVYKHKTVHKFYTK